MLKLEIPIEEAYDENRNEFVAAVKLVVELEHSLLSMSKWESKFEKPFLSTNDKTTEETLYYIEAMILDKVPENLFEIMRPEDLQQISNYINAKMSATWFSDSDDKPSKEVITSELMYYWMIALNIPFECERWHLNRLLTLIRVCNVKNTPDKKLSPSEIAKRNRELNAARKAKYGTAG